MHRISRFIKHLSAKQWLEVEEIRDWNVRRARYIKPGEYVYEPETVDTHSLDPLNSSHGTTYFLRKQVEIPANWKSNSIGLVFEAGGEGLLRVNGVSYHGLDRNHSFVSLNPDKIGNKLHIEIELFDPIPEPVDPLNAQSVQPAPIQKISIKLVRVNRPLQSLLYSIVVVHDAVRLMPEQDLKRSRLAEALYATMDDVYRQIDGGWADGEWIQSIERTFIEKVKGKVPDRSSGVMHMVGQSHIDIAWLWPIRETIRKVSRTFSTVCTLMDEYPEFMYSQSQPQLYAFVKEHDPELYAKIKARINEGRWELVGGMWVEPDLNIPSGESLVRQILYGQQFYKNEFGKTSSIEWLPDTFGYCASLPQILKLAGVQYFMTSKLNWNDTNKFPYDLFHWVGIDGTPIVSYLNHGLNENTMPRDIHEHWQSYRQKNRHDELMLLYGHGDGGGGVTREMIEYIERSDLLPDWPASRFSTAGQFFGQIGSSLPQLPKWHGDLYLELHRGTYTTHARNKRNNRKAEVLYREAEIWNSMPTSLANQSKISAQQDSIHQGWKLILLNQFHDIIPGTSIPEVYETSAQEYEQIFERGNSALAGALQNLVGFVSTVGDGKPYVVFNSLGWGRDEVISIEGDAELIKMSAYDAEGNLLASDVISGESDPQRYSMFVHVTTIPALGYKTIWLRSATGNDAPAIQVESIIEPPQAWETEFFILAFNRNGEIIRWYDKAYDRELLKPGVKANEFQFFHDMPTFWDAWDMDPRFEDQLADFVQLVDSKIVMKGKTCDIIRFRWTLHQSVISQDVIMYHHQRRVDFKTNVHWEETNKLLKVAFPIDLITNKATYEIPFGALERPTHRNTSWEQAQFEVCGHRWADISEASYGVSLLNDCKYGYDVKESTLRLSLLRAPKWPDNSADQGEHDFTYSLFPHDGDWRDAYVVRKAAELNHPVVIEASDVKAGPLPSEQSFIQFQSDHVLLDTIKQAEDGVGIVLRLYESSGSREQVTITLPQNPSKVYLINLLEEEIQEIALVDGKIILDFRPFEIKTIKCR